MFQMYKNAVTVPFLVIASYRLWETLAVGVQYSWHVHCIVLKMCLGVGGGGREEN